MSLKHLYSTSFLNERERDEELNWGVVKDKKWLIFQLNSMVLAVIAVIFAVYDNSYWLLFVFLSLIFMFLSVNRASKITNVNAK